jgi:hypothetical protein
MTCAGARGNAYSFRSRLDILANASRGVKP